MKVKEVTTNSEITLTKNNFVAAGGEGEIYRLKNKCYKIYTDSSKMLPQGKIKELSQLHLNNIINPISLLEDVKGNYVGYSMNFVDDCITLCAMFPPAFKQRNNIKIDSINKLVETMKLVVKEFHKNKMLVVDMNEYNFLIHDKYFDNLYLIDVDSCQTQSYKATAIMESIKDYHTTPFSEFSDWFSFAILTFQMYTGLHPFKGGKHPKIKNFTERMQQNISVYNKDVSVPAFIKDFENLIPKNFNDWYKIIFNSNKRDFPPDSFEGKVAKIIQKVIQKNASFITELFKEFLSNVIYYNSDFCITERGLVIGHRVYDNIASYSKVVKINDSKKYYSCIIKNKQVKIKDVIGDKEINCDVQAEYIIEPAKNFKINSELLYIINNCTLNILKISSKFNNVQISKLVDLAYSYKVLNNVIVQQVLDSVFVVLLRGIDKVYENIKINELAKQRIINAELNNNILIIITEVKGKLKRYIIKFDTKTQYYETYKILSIDEVTDTDINFIVLDSGICILSDIDKGLILFRMGFEDTTINIINDTDISGFKLYTDGSKALYADKNKLLSFKMK